MSGICEECGCVCARCTKLVQKHSDMHLHAEIENLRQHLMERDTHIVTMETQFLNEADKFPNGELASMQEELRIWQEKYSRLHDAHKRVQKVNQNLEDKLLRIVDKCETEKGAFAKDIATLSHRLADANYTIHRLTQDNEKYRNDVNLAIQLLQCKPSNFVGQKYDSLPSEVQAKVRTYVAQKRRSSDASPPDVKSITVPISTFPPTAMVYNITKTNVEKHSDDESDDSKSPVDVVSAAIMAKVLEDRERERIFAKHCDTCTCHRTLLTVDSETQTTSDRFDARVCDDCGSTEFRDDTKIYDFANERTTNATIFETETTNFRRSNDVKGSTTRQSIVENFNRENFTNANTKILRNANNVETTATMHGRNDNSTKSKMNTFSNERSTIVKSNANKTKQSRSMKRFDVGGEIRTPTASDHWSRYKTDVGPTIRADNEIPETTVRTKDPSPVEIINDRIWKSGFTNAKLHSTRTNDRNDDRKLVKNPDTRIDVINDRVWKNDASSSGANKISTQMTVIEVTNAVNSTITKEQTESAASPSFSSDSVVISTSNQSSSSSDVLHATHEISKRSNVSNGGKIGWNERTSGPRNCFVRVTPGSKNILLDNVGHYQTVLYTTGGNRPNTALVHVAKSTRSGRSTSTSSGENSPIVVTDDNTQLQRVAEWVQSSVAVAKTPIISKSRETTAKQLTPLIPNVGKNVEDTLVTIDIDDNAEATTALLPENSRIREIVGQPFLRKNLEDVQTTITFVGDEAGIGNVGATNALNDVSLDEHVEDLISFETCNDVEKSEIPSDSGIADGNEGNYEVKITKEMEEIYLKLTASLDPVSLRLASPSSSADLTIEKYRKDHRSRVHVQKLPDKPKQ